MYARPAPRPMLPRMPKIFRMTHLRGPRPCSAGATEDAGVALASRRALLRGAAVAEHPLEDDLRIELHRER